MNNSCNSAWGGEKLNGCKTYGGTGGSPFTEKAPQNSKISKITVSAGYVIDAIQLHYAEVEDGV